MSILEIITTLKEMGYSVESRKRSDGGYIITKIDGQKFLGAKGNTYARSIVNAPLSQARREQTTYNVKKYIKLKKGHHKAKGKISEEMNRQLKKVQRLWRKNKVSAKITKSKLRWHLKEGGEKEAWDYLQKMSRYGQGLAYEENVMYLAKYIEDIAISVSKNYKEKVLNVAKHIRESVTFFKEEWIPTIYAYWYEVIESKYSAPVIERAINSTYNTML